MADRYLVGATTNTTASWSDTSGGVGGFSIPVAGDNVYIDTNSPSFRLDANFVCRKLDFTGFVNTFTHGLGFTITIGDATPGTGNIALKFVAGMVYIKEHPSSCKIIFVSTSATVQSIYWAGKVSGDVEYNASSNGSWIYEDDHSWTDFLATVTFTKGTLNTNGKLCKGGQFTSSNSNVRNLTLGASEFRLTGVGNNCWLCATTTNLTVPAHTAIIKLYRSIACFAPLMQAGNFLWDFAVEYYGGGIATMFTTNNACRFKSVKVYGGIDLGDGREDRLQINNTGFTVTDTVDGLVVIGSATRRNRVHSNNTGIRTITVPNSTSVRVEYTDFNYITLSTTNDLSASVGGVGDLGSNTGIIFTTGITCYWYSNTPGVKNWTDPNNWFLASGGTGGQARRPLPQDDVRFDVNSIQVANTIVRCGVSCERLGRHIDWSGCLNNPNWDFQIDTIIYGSLTLIAGMTLTAYASAFINMNGSGTGNTFTLTSAGQTFPHIQFQFNMVSTNTYTFADDFSLGATALCSFFSGILNTNNKNFTAGRFTFDTHAVTNGTSIFTATSLSGNVFNITSFMTTYSASSSEYRITGTGIGAKNFVGSATSRTHGKLTISGAGDCIYTFSGTNTFANDFTTKNTVHTLAFTAGTTTTFQGNIVIVGGAGNYITLRSTTTSIFTWSKTSGTVNCDYMILSKSTVGGGATFNPGTSTIDGGNNTGWTGFTVDPFTWTNTDLDNDGSNPNNWYGGNVPGSSDIAVFTGAYNQNCSGFSQPVYGILLTQGYTGSVSSGVDIGAGGVDVHGGTLTIVNGIQNGGLRMTGGTLVLPIALQVNTQGSSRDTIKITGGTLTHSSGQIDLNGASEAIINTTSGRPFFNFNFGGVPTVSGTFFIDGATVNACSTLNADVSIKGNLAGSNFNAGTGIFRLIMTTTIQSSLARIPNLQINGSGTVNLNENLTVDGTTTITLVTSITTSLSKKLICKGSVSSAITTIGGTANLSIEGTAFEQIISGAGVFPGDPVINKDAGLVKLGSNMSPLQAGKTFNISKGQLCTNEFNLTLANNLTINPAGGACLNKTRNSNVYYGGALSGAITSVSKCYRGFPLGV